MRLSYHERTADEPEPWERELAEKIALKQAIVDTWNEQFHKGGPKDIVYVAELQNDIRHLKRKLAGEIEGSGATRGGRI